MIYIDKMVQAMIEIPKEVNHVLDIVKAKQGFKTKSEAIAFVVASYGVEMMEPEVRPEYLKKLEKIEKEKGIPFKNIEELRELIEGEDEGL